MHPGEIKPADDMIKHEFSLLMNNHSPKVVCDNRWLRGQLEAFKKWLWS